MTLSEIEPATLRVVAQCFYQQHHHMILHAFCNRKYKDNLEMVQRIPSWCTFEASTQWIIRSTLNKTNIPAPQMLGY